MQIIKFIVDNYAELLALWATVQVLLGGIGTLLSKSSRPGLVTFGHRLEALGADFRKAKSGKSRETESLSDAIDQAVNVELKK